MATHFRIKTQGNTIKEYTNKKVFETELWSQLKRAMENADDLEIPSTFSIHKYKTEQKTAIEVEIAYDMTK